MVLICEIQTVVLVSFRPTKSHVLVSAQVFVRYPTYRLPSKSCVMQQEAQSSGCELTTDVLLYVVVPVLYLLFDHHCSGF